MQQQGRIEMASLDRNSRGNSLTAMECVRWWRSVAAHSCHFHRTALHTQSSPVAAVVKACTFCNRRSCHALTMAASASSTHRRHHADDQVRQVLADLLASFMRL